ncbi:chorismate--pyruvate lyase family protein [Chitinimonas lacunae]|uniref:Probable chorismate pyruvate-lyase n=1 Tax=Chitinimonas lacunae TaxID=1963018 RepID=A0ABV8MJ75_9NEIS
MPDLASHRWGHPASRAPRRLQPWLTERGSLTARLRAHFPAVRVRLLRQGPGQPLRDELAPLGQPRPCRSVVREILLLSGDTPLVFAHSVMTYQSLRYGFGLLRHQGVKPLGATLFANPRVQRSPLAWRRLDRRHPLWRAAAAAVAGLPPQLWARRSRFTLGHAELLITEVFLPAILKE